MTCIGSVPLMAARRIQLQTHSLKRRHRPSLLQQQQQQHLNTVRTLLSTTVVDDDIISNNGNSALRRLSTTPIHSQYYSLRRRGVESLRRLPVRRSVSRPLHLDMRLHHHHATTWRRSSPWSSSSSSRLNLMADATITKVRSYHASVTCKNEEGGGDSGDSAAAKEDASATVTGPAPYSTPELEADAAAHKAGLTDPDVPEWQNPLHHNNPDMMKQFREDFDSEEEFQKAIQPAPPLSTSDGSMAGPAYLEELADEIVHLTMLEMNELVNRISHHYGFHEGMLSPDDDDGGVGDGGGDDGDDEDDEGAAPVEEKTAFDVKLLTYDAKAKIKVIKEVRALAGLGLKEAKELVEGVPTVVQKGVKKEEAESIKAKLEELGASVEVV